MNNVNKLAMRLKIDKETARELVSAGLGTPKLIRGLSDEKLEEKGIKSDKIEKIKAGIDKDKK